MVWRCRLPERRGLRHHSAPAGGCRGNGAAAMEGGGRPSAAQAVLLVASTALTALVYSVYRQKARVARGLEVGCDGPPGRGGGGFGCRAGAPARTAAWCRRLNGGLRFFPAGRQEGPAGRRPAGGAAGGAGTLRPLRGHRR